LARPSVIDSVAQRKETKTVIFYLLMTIAALFVVVEHKVTVLEETVSS
jgi:hypothetical protein